MAHYDTRPHNNTTTTTTERGGSTGLAFIVGILVVAVAVLAWFVFGGDVQPSDQSGDVNVTIEGAGGAGADAANAIEGAANAIGDAANDLGNAANDAAN